MNSTTIRTSIHEQRLGLQGYVNNTPTQIESPGVTSHFNSAADDKPERGETSISGALSTNIPLTVDHDTQTEDIGMWHFCKLFINYLVV